MQKAISEMRAHIGAIAKMTPTSEGYYVINSNAASKIARCVSDFALVYKDYDDDIYNHISSLAEKLFYPQKIMLAGSRTGGYAVNNIHLGYLDAAVDFCKSALFQTKPTEKSKKIFISHSSTDVEYVEAFVSMLEKIGVKKENLFCSSISGYDIPFGENIYDYLRMQFENHNIFIIFMLSKNYKKSPACLNEMGAAWALKVDYQAVLLPDFTYRNIPGAIDPRRISFRVNNVKERAGRLTEMKNKIIDFLGLPRLDEIIWERHKTGFVEEVDKIATASKK